MPTPQLLLPSSHYHIRPIPTRRSNPQQCHERHVAIEVFGIPSLPVAMGVYLPISTSAAMLLGGVIRWLVNRPRSREEREGADADAGPGVLCSSGLLAGGAIMGVLLAGLAARHGGKFDLSKTRGTMSTSNIESVIAYVVLLAVPLYLVARRSRSSIS